MRNVCTPWPPQNCRLHPLIHTSLKFAQAQDLVYCQGGEKEVPTHPPTGALGRWELGARSGAGYAVPLNDHFITWQAVFDKHGLNIEGQAVYNLFLTISRAPEKLFQPVPFHFSPANNHGFKIILLFCKNIAWFTETWFIMILKQR